jgi:hypothetical protein
MTQSGKALGSSVDEILKWVAVEMGVQEVYPTPVIMLVTKQELQKVFMEKNEKSFMLWTRTYGDKQTNEIIEQYLEDLLGLFIPETETIYIGDFMGPCKQQSIIAHELTHYFQVRMQQKTHSGDYTEEVLRLRNEMEASKIEQKFMDTFCGYHEVNPH